MVHGSCARFNIIGCRLDLAFTFAPALRAVAALRKLGGSEQVQTARKWAAREDVVLLYQKELAAELETLPKMPTKNLFTLTEYRSYL